ncbi:hypothetical protein GCM10007147_05080 [Nocardiopsis kunsanensis]|uniref:Uncharacterized protein n=1 Tax=Nocardiopsis kunsanensis TaxID=141693 RepID=A0A918X7V4_9ACTN|nr:hypothetical protein GCM10007147_05080 [Nocardiopsis kunsanensis]
MVGDPHTQGARKGAPEYIGSTFAAQRHNIPSGVEEDNANTDLSALESEGGNGTYCAAEKGCGISARTLERPSR